MLSDYIILMLTKSTVWLLRSSVISLWTFVWWSMVLLMLMSVPLTAFRLLHSVHQIDGVPRRRNTSIVTQAKCLSEYRVMRGQVQESWSIHFSVDSESILNYTMNLFQSNLYLICCHLKRELGRTYHSTDAQQMIQQGASVRMSFKTLRETFTIKISNQYSIVRETYNWNTSGNRIRMISISPLQSKFEMWVSVAQPASYFIRIPPAGLSTLALFPK